MTKWSLALCRIQLVKTHSMLEFWWRLEKVREWLPPTRQCPRPLMRKKWKGRGREKYSSVWAEASPGPQAAEQGRPRRERCPVRKEGSLHLARGKDERSRDKGTKKETKNAPWRTEGGRSLNYPIKGHQKCHLLSVKESSAHCLWLWRNLTPSNCVRLRKDVLFSAGLWTVGIMKIHFTKIGL